MDLPKEGVMKRQTKKLLEVNQETLLLALEERLDVEVNMASEKLRRMSAQVNRNTALDILGNIHDETRSSYIAISDLKGAIDEIRSNLGLNNNSTLSLNTSSNFAADDIPF
jgi:hypothetical protein